MQYIASMTEMLALVSLSLLQSPPTGLSTIKSI